MDNTPGWLIYVLSAGLAAGALVAWSRGAVNAKLCKGAVLLSMLPLLLQGRAMMPPSTLPILRSAYSVLVLATIVIGFVFLFWGIITSAHHKQSSRA